MPVTNENELKTPFAKYGVFTSATYGGTYTLNKRIILNNFRTQLRGLGSAGFTILPKDQVNDPSTQEVVEGHFVKILDTTQFFEEEYSSVGDEVFFGRISSVTFDVYEGKNDQKGQGAADEIGVFFQKKPIVWTSKPQVFNPIVSGVAYGNKSPSGEGFESLVSAMTKVEMTGDTTKFPNTASLGSAGNDRVWSLESFLRYMASKHDVEIKFPWEFNTGDLSEDEKTQLAKQYTIFKDTLEVRSFDHYDGKSFQELLSEVIEEPFDWFITAESASYPTFRIINKSPVVALDWYPAAILRNKKIDESLTTNFNITKADETYDRLIYRGDNILVAGSWQHWNANGAATMVAGWTDSEEQNYVNCTSGNLDLYTGETQKAIASAYRAKIKNVYQQFTYKNIADACPIQIPKKVDNTGVFTQAAMYHTIDGQEQFDRVPFFPKIEFTKYENGSTYVLTKPTVYNTLSLHKTPPLLEIRWADTLPWKENADKDNRKPFMIAQTLVKDSDGTPRYFNYDITKNAGNDTFSFTHTVDGIKLDIGIPETLAYVDADGNMFDLDGNTVDASVFYWDDTATVSVRNPATDSYKYFTNWKMLGATVAGFSDQRLEWTIDNPNVSGSKNNVKIIEDKSLQCWFAHAGTIREINSQPYYVGKGRNYVTGFDRFLKDTFIRNDFKKLYDLARQTSNWLFTPKISAKIDLSLSKYVQGSWNIGEMVAKISDGVITHTINTVVASIEYDLVSNRVYISTSIPEMPQLKRIQSTPTSRSMVAPSSNSKDATLEASSKVIVKAPQPTIGYVSGGATGGAAATTASSNLYYIVSGQSLSYLGAVGCKHVTTPITTAASGYADGVPTTLPDGICWIRSLDDNSFKLAFNDSTSYISYDISQQPVYAVKTGVVTGGSLSGANWSYDKYTICGAP